MEETVSHLIEKRECYMPYKFESEKKIIGNNPTLDKRYKLTDEDKENIKKDYETGSISINGLARKYNVSKRTIQFTLFPERKKRNQELAKERRKDGRYYDKVCHPIYQTRFCVLNKFSETFFKNPSRSWNVC